MNRIVCGYEIKLIISPNDMSTHSHTLTYTHEKNRFDKDELDNLANCE